METVNHFSHEWSGYWNSYVEDHVAEFPLREQASDVLPVILHLGVIIAEVSHIVFIEDWGFRTVSKK